MNVVIPMAGQGSRFVEAGYKEPKPFIEIFGKTLIELVLENLYMDNARYILLVRAEHMETQAKVIQRIQDSHDVTFLTIDKLTEGAASTILHAHRLIDNNAPLLLANSDQYVEMNIADYIGDCVNKELDGSILTFIDDELNPKWSFAKINDHGIIEEVKEKKAISQYATVGIYYFSKGSSFVKSAIDMIIANDRVNGEFYTCPVYNYGIAVGEKFGIYNIEAKKMHGLGTPEDLNKFIEYYKCR
ncbi:glycosyltransferase family 2 protein [Alphaproteobacteria bacterium]|nr:glycosyltransferase family 2 protein [Alphaproteobacteria bacterium]